MKYMESSKIGRAASMRPLRRFPRNRPTFVLGLALLLISGCSKESPVEAPPTAACVKDAVRAIYRVETATVEAGKRPKFTSLDVAGLTARDLERKLRAFADPSRTHLWMPGAQKWLIVEHTSEKGVSLEKAMDAFIEDESCKASLPETFASYVGTLDEVLPAFEAKLEGEVVPEWFVTKKIPTLGWLDTTDIDEDILKPTLQEIRSMQVVRRVILEGNMAVAKATDKKGEEAAIEQWAKAYLRNPNDPLLNERREHLRNNAKGFIGVNKVVQAMKCYETLVLINPKDMPAVYGFGKCLENIGRADVAKEVLQRAEELRKIDDAANAD